MTTPPNTPAEDGRGAEAFTMPIQRVGPFTFPLKDADRLWAHNNHGQTLERLRERGGMSWCEMAAIMEWRRWEPMNQASARARCEEIARARGEK